MQNRNDLIYVPEEGLPILIPKAHRYATTVLDAEHSYIRLPVESGVEMTLYIINQTKGEKLNTWVSNIYAAANYHSQIYGPVVVVATQYTDKIQHGLVVAKAGDLIKPTNFHIQLLQSSLSREALSRAALLNILNE